MKKFICLDDALDEQVFSSYLREYVVPVRVLKKLPKIDEREDPEEEKNEMLRILFNRCYALTGVSGMCLFCGLQDACNKYRSVGKD